MNHHKQVDLHFRSPVLLLYGASICIQANPHCQPSVLLLSCPLSVRVAWHTSVCAKTSCHSPDITSRGLSWFVPLSRAFLFWHLSARVWCTTFFLHFLPLLSPFHSSSLDCFGSLDLPILSAALRSIPSIHFSIFHCGYPPPTVSLPILCFKCKKFELHFHSLNEKFQVHYTIVH